jgi:hypothetical protein
LAPFARYYFLIELDEEQPQKIDLFGTWDAWDAIRKMCKYHSRLFVGKNNRYFFSAHFPSTLDFSTMLVLVCSCHRMPESFKIEENKWLPDNLQL